MALRMMKHQYFSGFGTFLESHPMVMFNVTRPFLRKEDLGEHLQGFMEEFVQHLIARISQIRSKLELKHNANPLEMPWEQIGHIILKQYDPVKPGEMDRILRAASTITCLLEPCCYWLLKLPGQ